MLSNFSKIPLIPIGDEWDFCLLEWNCEDQHPISEYYFQARDISINVELPIKWSLWGYFFLKVLSSSLNEIDCSLYLTECIKSFKREKTNKILTADNEILENFNDFNTFLKKTSKEVYISENMKIHFKLKMDPQEFILITSVYTPSMLILRT